MAKGVEGFGEAAVVESSTTDTAANANAGSLKNVDKESGSKSEFKMQEISDMLSKLKLNPMAKEFFPSSYIVIGPYCDQSCLLMSSLLSIISFSAVKGTHLSAGTLIKISDFFNLISTVYMLVSINYAFCLGFFLYLVYR